MSQSPLLTKRTIRRHQLREIVPLADATIYDMEQRREFPQRFALSSGLMLGGTRSVVLMQSSGVGNCLNIFTLAENCRLPLVLLVTMRGEFAEFVPWQVPMGKRTGAALELMGFDVYRAEDAAAVGEICHGAIDQAYYSNRSVAVLLSQRLIGRKNWSK
jgi:sulfopyruvate decarboxylase TPP-binding subunit